MLILDCRLQSLDASAVSKHELRSWLQAEIVDETDIYEDVERRVPRQVAARADMATLMTMFEHKLRHQRFLSMSEVQVLSSSA